MDIFSTREWAAIIWGVIILIYVLTKKETRGSLYNLLDKAFEKKLIILWIVYVLYISAITYLFYSLSIWKMIYIKDIIIWALFSGLIYFSNATTDGADESYIRTIIKDNFKIIIIYEFIINLFTFNIFVELLILPVFTLISTPSFIYDKKIKRDAVHRFTNYIFTVMSIIFIYKTIEIAIGEYKYLDALDTLISFLIPITYLVLTLPPIYFISLYSQYEQLFSRMSSKEGEDKKVNRRRRFEIMKICNFSTRKVKKYKNNYMPRMYTKLTDEEFNNLINEFKLQV